MNTFETYLKEQLVLHPSAQPQDVVKLCYQAAHGAEHLLCDIAAAKKYFDAEFDAAEPANIPLYEQISPNTARVNLAAWKQAKLPREWLFNMFAASASLGGAGENRFDEYLAIAERVIEVGAPFPLHEWRSYLDSYGGGAVHHSERYRAAESPRYRIVRSSFVGVFPILQKLAPVISAERPTVLAMDGRAASGKSTAAKTLCEIFGCDAVHMDDFFLPPSLRTAERLSEVGGNVHYERFESEVLPFLSKNEGFAYPIFDCSKMDFDGERVISKSNIRVVEGAYSHHPRFGAYADLKVFFDVTPETQMQRILARNGEKMAKMFESRWIPMEEAYFAEYDIKQNADIVVEYPTHL